MKENNFIAPVWFYAVAAVGMIAQAVVFIRSINLAEDTMKWCKKVCNQAYEQIGIKVDE